MARGASYSVTIATATTATAGTSAGIATAPATATGTISTAVTTAAAKFLRTRFIDLELAALDIEAIEFADGLGGVIFGTQFDETEATGAAGFPVGDNARGADFIAFAGEQLEEKFIGDAEREIAYIEFSHIFPLFPNDRATIRPRCCIENGEDSPQC
jgi:hypothetical protein